MSNISPYFLLCVRLLSASLGEAKRYIEEEAKAARQDLVIL